MKWFKKDLDLIEKYRLEIDTDPDRFIENCLTDLEIVVDHKTLTRVVFGLCLLLNRPLFLDVNRNSEIEVSVKIKESLLGISYLCPEDTKKSFEEVLNLFFRDLVDYYEIDQYTAGKLCRLVHRR